jgi:hypothetical protein
VTPAVMRFGSIMAVAPRGTRGGSRKPMPELNRRRRLHGGIGSVHAKRAIRSLFGRARPGGRGRLTERAPLPSATRPID